MSIRKTILVGILFTALLGSTSSTLAQETASDTTVNKHTIRKLVHWVSVFTMYSDLELSDKVDLAEYAEAADIAAGFISNPELSAELAKFRAATFVNVYPKGMMGGNQWITTKLNEVSDAQYTTLNAPYLSLEVWFTPVSDNSGYLTTVVLKPSEAIKENISAAQTQINSSLNGKKFSSPREAKETVNNAIFGGLAQLQALLGLTYAPNIAIRFEDKLYLSGQTIETWQRTDGLARLEAVDRNGNLLSGNLTWTGVRGGGSAVDFLVNESRTDYVTLRSGADQIRVTIRVKEFNLNVEDLLKELLLEVVGEKLQKAREDIDKIRADSAQTVVQVGEVRTQLDNRLGVAPSIAASNSGFESEAVQDSRLGTQAEMISLKSDPVMNEYIEARRLRFYLIAQSLLQIKIEIFLRSIIMDEATINVYVLSIRDNSPELIAELIVNALRNPENRQQVKDLVITFLNKQIDEVASRS